MMMAEQQEAMGINHEIDPTFIK